MWRETTKGGNWSSFVIARCRQLQHIFLGYLWHEQVIKLRQKLVKENLVVRARGDLNVAHFYVHYGVSFYLFHLSTSWVCSLALLQINWESETTFLIVFPYLDINTCSCSHHVQAHRQKHGNISNISNSKTDSINLSNQFTYFPDWIITLSVYSKFGNKTPKYFPRLEQIFRGACWFDIDDRAYFLSSFVLTWQSQTHCWLKKYNFL